MMVIIEIDEYTAANLWWALGIAEGGLRQQGRPEAAEIVHRTFISCQENCKDKEGA